MKNILQRIDSATDYIKSKIQSSPAIGLVLGSGLGDFAQTLDDKISIPFGEIPGFPTPTVEGHAGFLVIGRHEGHLVAALSGRVHFYEGLPQNEITIPVRVLRRLGVGILILTNAAGGVNSGFKPGTLMMINDHINFSGNNPLIGANLGEFGPRFPDMSNVYTKELRTKIIKCAEEKGYSLAEGVYAMCSGPNYETAAEVRMFRQIGADAVGMSTVPEAIVASHAGMKVVGISCITNMATGVYDQPLYHEEVVETANRVKAEFTGIVAMVIGICTTDA
jgi:purine nucleoside phosphorylase I, inosine and guanosine-specific